MSNWSHFYIFNSLNVFGWQTVHSVRENPVKQWEWGAELAEDHLKLSLNYLKKAKEGKYGACFSVCDKHSKKIVSHREELYESRAYEQEKTFSIWISIENEFNMWKSSENTHSTLRRFGSMQWGFWILLG